MSTQRPSHNPSKNLSLNELQCLYDLLGPDCVTLATAVVQILYGSDNIWKKHACGVLCYIKDYTKRSYYLRLYDLRSKKELFEELVPPSLSLEKSLDLFYTFDGLKDKFGINFVDKNEAETFCKLFHEKQQNQYKKMTDHKLTNTQQTSLSSLVNGIKPPTNAVIKSPMMSPQMSEKKIKLKPVKNDKKKRNRPVTISGPLPDSFDHIMHVGTNASFLNDDTQQKLFEQVVTGMKMTPDEEIYIRRTIKNTDHGLEKLFTKTSHHNDIPPEIPPRTHALLKGSNHNRVPFQDISQPTLTYNLTNKNPPLPQLQNTSNQSEKFSPPIVPPRPARHVLNNIQQPIKASRAPPPPPSMPVEQPNPSIPVAPPLPPPPPPPVAPMFLIEQTIKQTPTVSSNSDHNSLLKDIRGFNTVKLKPATDRPTTIPKTSENTSNVDTQKTLEENIRDLLEKRRKELMGSDNEENESDSDDDDWCA